MLQIRNLRKSFGDLQVLKGIDLDVNKGDVVAILGPSGSGKTTMLRCLNFLEKSDGGTMLFDDQRVDLARVTHAEANALRRRTGFVFQSYNLFANKTALQNVTEGLIIARKMPRRRAEEIARAALVKVGMDDRADYYPSQLSGLFVRSSDVAVIVGTYFLIVSIGYVLNTVTNCYLGALNGMGKPSISMFLMIFYYIVVRMPLAYLLSYLGFGLNGIWVAVLVSHIVASLAATMTGTVLIRKKGNIKA